MLIFVIKEKKGEQTMKYFYKQNEVILTLSCIFLIFCKTVKKKFEYFLIRNFHPCECSK